MNSHGLRILDKKENCIAVKLPEILTEIENGAEYTWSIFFLDAVGVLTGNKTMKALMKETNESKTGIHVTWKELVQLSERFEDIYDITVVGDQNQTQHKKYNNDQEMYETYDIVIEMIDSSYWEIFTQSPKLLEKFKKKFNDVISLEPDFEK